jgi:hypothetical protein
MRPLSEKSRFERKTTDVEPIWKSAAFRSLAAWIRSRPRVRDRFSDYNAYLPGWYEAARAVVANELQ